MAGNNLDQQFTNSCVVLDYPCSVGDKFVDPCMCGKFFLCEHTTTIIHQSCSDGTLYNHLSRQCERAEDVAVINKLCDIYNPWVRCANVSAGSDIPALQERCTGITPTSTSTLPPKGTPAPDSGVNTGAIVGAVIAVLLVIAVVVAVVIVFKKRGKPVSHYLGFLTLKKSVENPKYDNQDETYAEINDAMRDPVYKDSFKGDSSPRVPDRPSFTLSPALNVSQDSNKFKGRPGHEDVAYDNPGYTPSNDDDDIIEGNTSLKVSSQKPPTVTMDTEDESNRLSYSVLERSSLEVPTSKAYTPLSVYTRGPNPNARPETGGILQLNDNEYQMPKPMPDYYELDPDSKSVS